MRRHFNIINVLLVVVLMIYLSGCGEESIYQNPDKPIEVTENIENNQVDILSTAWLDLHQEEVKTDSWSIVEYGEDFLPQMTEGKLENRFYAMDNNMFYVLSEIWKKQKDGKKTREYQLTEYNVDLSQCENSLYSLKWNHEITGFDNLIQGMEQLTYHIVRMDCLDGIFSLLVEGTDEERNVPLFYVVDATEDGQVLNILDLSDTLLKNEFQCPADRMPGDFHKNKNGTLFIMDSEMLQVFVLYADGTFVEAMTSQNGKVLNFRGKLSGGEPVYDYINQDGTRTILTYDGTQQKCVYKGEINWLDGVFFSRFGKVYFVENNSLKCWNVVEGKTEILSSQIEKGEYHYLWMNDNSRELFLIEAGSYSPYIVKLTNEPPKESVELSLCITTRSQYVKECAIAYNTRHPDVKISIEEVSNFDEKAMNTLFADISNDKGPDILVLGRKHLVSFYRAGALADLSAFLSDDTKAQVFPGVLEYGTVDNKLVGVTCEASLSTLFVSNEVWNGDRWGLADVLELIRKRENGADPIERVVGSSYTQNQMLFDLSMQDITDSVFVDLDARTCDFNRTEFLMLLEYCKKYGKESVDGNYKDDEELIAELRNGRSLAHGFSGNFLKFSKVMAMLGDDYHCVGYPSESRQGSYFEFYDGCVAVSSKSSKSSEASDFIRYLLEYSTQKKYGTNWVRKDVLADSVMDAVERYGEKDPVPLFFKTESKVIPLAGKKDGSSFVQEYMELAENCGFRKEECEPIKSIILEEVPAFFYGEKSADQVAKAIQNRVSLYLQEN